jgi:hypothetical protein
MFCSIGRTKRRDTSGFKRDAGETDSEYIASRVRRFAEALQRRWRAREGRAKLLRYEELSLAPRRTWIELTELLETESDRATIDELLKRAARKEAPAEAHRTTPDAKSSIGRWQRDLSSELVEVFADVLDPLLSEFGCEAEITGVER